MSNADVESAELIIAKHLPLLYGGSWQGQIGAARGIIAHLEAAGYSVARRDEIARLREALNHIARDDHATPDVIGWNDTDSLKAVRQFARRALEGITPAGLDRQGPRNDAG